MSELSDDDIPDYASLQLISARCNAAATENSSIYEIQGVQQFLIIFVIICGFLQTQNCIVCTECIDSFARLDTL